MPPFSAGGIITGRKTYAVVPICFSVAKQDLHLSSTACSVIGNAMFSTGSEKMYTKQLKG